jgi:hypothetical protein
VSRDAGISVRMAVPGSQMLTELSKPQDHLTKFSDGHVSAALEWLDRLHDLTGDDKEMQEHFEQCVASLSDQHTRAESAKKAFQRVRCSPCDIVAGFLLRAGEQSRLHRLSCTYV